MEPRSEVGWTGLEPRLWVEIEKLEYMIGEERNGNEDYYINYIKQNQ
mgnify:CR=1 FL=1